MEVIQNNQEQDGTMTEKTYRSLQTKEQILEYLSQSEGAVSAVVVDGPGMGYRCIAGKDGFIWESIPAEENHCLELRRKICASGGIDTSGEGCLLEEVCGSGESRRKEVSGLMEPPETGQKIFTEIFGRRPELVLCGGGHVAMAVLQLAQFLGIPATVIEDRPYFADQARAAGAKRVICDSFAQALEEIRGGLDTYFVIMTRGHRHDKVCLESILRKPFAYAGMMGSRSRVRLLKEVLQEEGFSDQELDMLHAPIGLDIGSETPEEIAVSVMAEIIRVKNRNHKTSSLSDEIRDALLQPEKKVLATIVKHKGSAPRQVGTKMVIFRDGRIAGTIGGGCMEAEVIGHSRELLREADGSGHCRLVHLNMTNQDAEESGMVCGGTQDVFLEILR